MLSNIKVNPEQNISSSNMYYTRTRGSVSLLIYEVRASDFVTVLSTAL